MNNRHSTRSLTLLSTLAVAIVGCGDSEEASQQQQGRPPALVRITEIQRREVSPKVTGIGTVVPLRTSVVASAADGVVKSYGIQIGQFVAEGEILSELRMVSTDIGIREAKAVLAERSQELAELENGSRVEEVEAARAKMLAAKALDERMTARHTRAIALFRNNATNRDELDEAKEAAEGARQAHLAATANYRLVSTGPRKEVVEQARARHEAQAVKVEFLEAEKKKRTTKAPFDGYVIMEHTYIGQFLKRGDPVVTLARLDQINVAVSVDQRDLRNVQLGKTASVHFPENKTTVTGTIVSVVPRSDWQSGSRGFPVLVRMKNQFKKVGEQNVPLLKEGMMAEVTFTGEPEPALLVPKDSIVRTSRGRFLYVYQPGEEGGNGLARQVQIETGLSEGAWIQVFGEGLDQAAQVVNEGAERLSRPVQEVQLAKEAS